MATTNPTFSVTLDTNDITKPLTYQEATFAVNGIWEGKPVQKASDAFNPLPISGIDVISKIIVAFPATETGTVRITLSTGPTVQTLPAQGIFIYCPTPTQAALITDISVSVDSVTDITLDARIFGS